MVNQNPRICFIIIFCLALSATNCYSQSINDLINEAKHFKHSPIDQIINLTALIDTIEQLEYYDTLGNTHYYIANRYVYLNKLDSTITHAKKSISAFDKSDYRKYRYNNNYALIGNAYFKLGNDYESRRNFEKLLSLSINDERSYKAIGEAHYRIAEMHRTRGDYNSAISYLENVIMNDDFSLYSNYSKASIFRELSFAYSYFLNEDKIDLAKEYIEKSNILLDSLDVRYEFYVPENKTLNLQHMALLSLMSQDTARANVYYNESIKICSKYKDDIIFQNLSSISSIGKAHILNQKTQFDQSLSILNKISQNHKSNNYRINIKLQSFLILRKIEALIGNQEFTAALEHTNKLINLYTSDQGLNDVNSLQSIIGKKSLIKCLIYRFDLLRRSKSTATNVLISKTDSLIDFHIQDLYFTSSISHIKSTMDPTQINITAYYRNIIDYSYEIEDIDLFWHISEKLNNLLVLRNIKINEQDLHEEQIFNVTKNIKTTELNISELESELYLSKTLNKDYEAELNQQIVILKSELLSLYEERSSFFSDIKFEIPSLEKTQKTLSKDESLINYTFGQNNLYAVHLNKHTSEFKQFTDAVSIKKACLQWYQLCSRTTSDSQENSELNSSSNLLYNKLFSPWPTLSSSITIIPDAELHYINFDALFNENGDFVLQDYNVHYIPSASFKLLNRNRRITVDKISLFNPDYKSGKMVNLKNTELSEMEGMHGLHHFSQEDATRENFIEALRSSDIIHYGGHAILEEKNNHFSYLMLQIDTTLSSGIITLGDLYALSTSAKLVSLPACNTASGDLIAGEGISNLSRGFFFAGAKSIISALWPANDKSTNGVMNDFYKYLKLGMNKGESLRMAKLDYLESSPEYLRHPYYWAGLNVTGQNTPVKFNGGLNLYWITIPLLLFLLLIFLLYQSRKPIKKMKSGSH